MEDRSCDKITKMIRLSLKVFLFTHTDTLCVSVFGLNNLLQECDTVTARRTAILPPQEWNPPSKVGPHQIPDVPCSRSE